jgi:hypothetical protein
MKEVVIPSTLFLIEVSNPMENLARAESRNKCQFSISRRDETYGGKGAQTAFTVLE